MSVLLIQLPARPKHAAAAATPRPAEVPAPEPFAYVWSADGLSPTRTGHAAAAQLPRAHRVLAVLPASDVSWHRISLPKAPAGRLRQALAGVLEEALLDDPDELHLALGPTPTPREDPAAAAGLSSPSAEPRRWVAATDHQTLLLALQSLEQHGLHVDAVVPAHEPAEAWTGHFQYLVQAAAPADDSATGAAPPALVLTLSGPAGVTRWPATASVLPAAALAAAGVPAAQLNEVRYTATPAAAAAAEQWLGGTPLVVISPEQRLLLAARSAWNLRQFDLAPAMRGMRRLRAGLRDFAGPNYRWLRWGLVGLIVIQGLGLNLLAWRHESTLAQERVAMNRLLQETHPQVRSVLDAPVQMLRETESLRAAAGKPGDSDLETLLDAAAAHWPEGAPPIQSISYDGSRLLATAPGFSPEALAQLRERLHPQNLSAELREGQITLQRAERRQRPG
jgi:general secretion pathway protein L